MSYITIRDNHQLYVKDWGAGSPVILLHGWPLSADSWDEPAAAIAKAGLRAIFYDRRGFGRSDQPWEGYDYDTLADDLDAVIEATGAQNATIVGFSMGGGEVAHYLTSLTEELIMSKTTKIDQRPDVNPQTGEHKYGEVEFADPVNNKYPIDTPDHVRAAWSYINHKDNAAQYDKAEVELIKKRIKRAAKKQGVEISEG